MIGPLLEVEHRLTEWVSGPPRYPNAAGLAAESPHVIIRGLSFHRIGTVDRCGRCCGNRGPAPLPQAPGPRSSPRAQMGAFFSLQYSSHHTATTRA
jgi:hypothetical protein